MTLGQTGWIACGLLGIASVALMLSCLVARSLSRLSISPVVKAWSWRLALLQPLLAAVLGAEFVLQSYWAWSSRGLQVAAAGLAAFWIFVAAVRLVQMVERGLQARRALGSLSQAEAPAWARGVRADFRLMPDLASPVVALIPRAVIAAPPWCWQGSREARMAVAHEAAHLRRWDIQWHLVGTASAALFWFHPLAEKALRELAFWQECAADEAAMREVGCGAEAYVELLMDIIARARQPAIPGTLSLRLQAQAMGRRLEIALQRPQLSAWLGYASLLLLVAPLLVFTATSPPSTPEVREIFAPARMP